MYTGTTIFSQVMRHLPWHHFHRIVQHYGGDYKVKSFRCADHYRVMAFAQLTYRESLRDIEACLRAMRSKLFHMGIRSTVSRNNLSNANERRDWRIYAEFAQGLSPKRAGWYTGGPGSRPERDRLCLGLHDHRPVPLGLPLGALPLPRGRSNCIPCSTCTAHSRVRSDLGRKTARCPRLGPPDSLSRCLLHHGSRIPDFGRLYRLHSARSLFVTRAKANFKFRRRYSHPVDRTTGLICDQTVLLSTFYPAKAYPEPLRRIKAFYGTSPNAVKTQIWIALSTYLLIAIIHKRLYLELPLYTILQVLSVSLFEKTPILQAFQDMHYITQNSDIHKQLMLFD